jgi:hypothetical protein
MPRTVWMPANQLAQLVDLVCVPTADAVNALGERMENSSAVHT